MPCQIDTNYEEKIILSKFESQRNNSNPDKKESELLWASQGPLSNFPRGSIAGDCLHRILERLDFCKSVYEVASKEVVEEELRR